ncbi:hypothetical protein MIR68_007500 [Amoeboaphelidium protococcarum]|nr:hypothetical protein MIR68_007500 [Amoeboaphelidium protococcarum]
MSGQYPGAGSKGDANGHNPPQYSEIDASSQISSNQQVVTRPQTNPSGYGQQYPQQQWSQNQQNYPSAPQQGGYQAPIPPGSQYYNTSPVQQPQYQQQQQQQTVLQAVELTPNPQALFCPYCKQVVVSNVRTESGALTWLSCAGLTIIGCIPCCLIPFCVQSCLNSEHLCPRCGLSIGYFRRL